MNHKLKKKFFFQIIQYKKQCYLLVKKIIIILDTTHVKYNDVDWSFITGILRLINEEQADPRKKTNGIRKYQGNFLYMIKY